MVRKMGSERSAAGAGAKAGERLETAGPLDLRRGLRRPCYHEQDYGQCGAAFYFFCDAVTGGVHVRRCFAWRRRGRRAE